MRALNKTMMALFGLPLIISLTLHAWEEHWLLLLIPIALAIFIITLLLMSKPKEVLPAERRSLSLTAAVHLLILGALVFLVRGLLSLSMEYDLKEAIMALLPAILTLSYNALLITVFLHILLHVGSHFGKGLCTVLVLLVIELTGASAPYLFALREEGSPIHSILAVIIGTPLLDEFYVLAPDELPLFSSWVDIPARLLVFNIVFAAILFLPFAAFRGHHKAPCSITGEMREYVDVYCQSADKLTFDKDAQIADGKETLEKSLNALGISQEMTGGYTVVKQGTLVKNNGRPLTPNHRACPCHGLTVYAGEFSTACVLYGAPGSSKTVITQELYVAHGGVAIPGTAEYLYAKTVLVEPYQKGEKLPATMDVMTIAPPLPIKSEHGSILLSDMPGERSNFNATVDIKKRPHIKHTLVIDMTMADPLQKLTELVDHMERERGLSLFSPFRPKIVLVLTKCDKPILGNTRIVDEAMQFSSVEQRSNALRRAAKRKRPSLYKFITKCDRLCGHPVTVTACAPLGSEDFADRDPQYMSELLEAMLKG